ncbi:MAG: DinB family protein [Acidobacteriota bacterium]
MSTLAAPILAAFQIETAKTRTLLERVPEDKFGWRPHAKSMTLANLAGHIAETPTWIDGFVIDVFDMGAEGQKYVPYVPKTRAALLETFDKNNADFLTKFGALNDETLAGTWTMKAGGQVVWEAPRHAAIHDMMINHTIHHRGQLTVYLRLLDVALPPLYGPTADNPQGF